MSALPKLSVTDIPLTQPQVSPLSESVDSSSSESDNTYQYKSPIKPQLPTQLPPIQCCIARNLNKMNQIACGNTSQMIIESQVSNQSAASSPKSPLKERQCSFLPQIPLMVIPSNPGKSARSLINRNKCSNCSKKYKGNVSNLVLPPMQDSIYSNLNTNDKENTKELSPLAVPPAEHYHKKEEHSLL